MTQPITIQGTTAQELYLEDGVPSLLRNAGFYNILLSKSDGLTQNDYEYVLRPNATLMWTSSTRLYALCEQVQTNRGLPSDGFAPSTTLEVMARTTFTENPFRPSFDDRSLLYNDRWYSKQDTGPVIPAGPDGAYPLLATNNQDIGLPYYFPARDFESIIVTLDLTNMSSLSVPTNATPWIVVTIGWTSEINGMEFGGILNSEVRSFTIPVSSGSWNGGSGATGGWATADAQIPDFSIISPVRGKYFWVTITNMTNKILGNNFSTQNILVAGSYKKLCDSAQLVYTNQNIPGSFDEGDGQAGTLSWNNTVWTWNPRSGGFFLQLGAATPIGNYFYLLPNLTAGEYNMVAGTGTAGSVCHIQLFQLTAGGVASTVIFDSGAIPYSAGPIYTSFTDIKIPKNKAIAARVFVVTAAGNSFFSLQGAEAA